MGVPAEGLQIEGDHDRAGGYGAPTRDASMPEADVELESGVGDRELNLVSRVVSMQGAQFDHRFRAHFENLRTAPGMGPGRAC